MLLLRLLIFLVWIMRIFFSFRRQTLSQKPLQPLGGYRTQLTFLAKEARLYVLIWLRLWVHRVRSLEASFNTSLESTYFASPQPPSMAFCLLANVSHRLFSWIRTKWIEIGVLSSFFVQISVPLQRWIMHWKNVEGTQEILSSLDIWGQTCPFCRGIIYTVIPLYSYLLPVQKVSPL